jgi:hypothetical protein
VGEWIKMSSDGYQLLQKFIDLAPYFNDLFVEDISVSIQDKERILHYIPGKKIDLGIKNGDLLKEGSVSYQVVQTGSKVIRMVGREVHGIPYIDLGFPIFHEQNVVGCITTITSIDQRERLLEMAETLSASMQQFSASIQSTSASSELLYQHNEDVMKQIQLVHHSINQIEKIAKTVYDVSSQVNILGLNASIEAARAGEHGRGFSVVAKEVRKLADHTGQSTKHISTELKMIQDSVEKLIASNQTVYQSTETLTKNLTELTGLIQELTSMATSLSTMAQIDNTQ